MNPTNSSKLPPELTLTQIAERLRVDRTTVWRWYDEGKLPRGRRRGPGKTSPIVIQLDKLEEFEREYGLVALNDAI